MNISLVPNSVAHAKIPYLIRAEITSLTIDVETVHHIPVYRHTNGKDMYNVEICGFRVEAEDTDKMLYLADRLLRGLVNMSRLPTYVFIARRSRQMYPVYTVGDEVFATTPGGPVFRHVELAKVRDYLTDYLHAVGELGRPGKSEKLHVRGVNQNSLALIRPIFYLKKRPEFDGDNEFWAPVFVADDEKSIYTYAASGKREVDFSGGYEALLLRTQVAQALIADYRLRDNFDLRLDRLLPEYWEKVKRTLKLYPARLTTALMALDVYQNGRGLIGVEYREDEDRYSLYLGKDLEDLRDRVARDFVRRGLMGLSTSLKVRELM
ncbi:MAG: hypothetical protein D6784_01235 [Chloroflexi bacterium]|nr:MAG: hypothetical protein D6784_01235 [Chloroflexota bacterium]